MSKLAELFKQGRYDEMWDICCSFIDLELKDFMAVQNRLLMEQVDMLKKCEIGKHILNGADPKSVREFRENVPLTDYDDYAPYLLKRRMDVLPKKPIMWQYTSGKSGEYAYRWAPVTARQMDQIEQLVFAMLFFSNCKGRKDVSLKEFDEFFYGMAPPPYATGTLTRVLPHEIFNFLPPVEEAELMGFEERVKKGFDEALNDGLDICFAMSSVAVAIGNRLGQKNGKTDYKALIRKPKKLIRLLKGLIKSKIAGRPMMPKDIWKLKSLITFGIDGSVFREKIKEMWGRYPLDVHGCTEAPLIAMQTWDHEGMTLIPHLNFFEFIPEEEAMKTWQDKNHQPKTYTVDELTPGNYELVITNLHGGPLTRYRLGHLVKITSMRNEKLNIDIPQMQFIGRVDDQLDVAGFTRLSEKTVWKAIENSGVKYKGWTARKETINGKPFIKIYIETEAKESMQEEDIAQAVHEELKKLYKPYAELESFTGIKPLKVSILEPHSFELFKVYQKSIGADLANLKPPHINATDETLSILTRTKEEKVANLGRKKVAV